MTYLEAAIHSAGTVAAGLLVAVCSDRGNEEGQDGEVAELVEHGYD